MFFNFYLFDLVCAEDLNKNCIKLTQKKNNVWNLETVQKTSDIDLKTIYSLLSNKI